MSRTEAAARVAATGLGERAAVRATVGVAAALVVALLVTGAWNAVTSGSDFFNPDLERSLFQLVSAAATATAAAAALARGIVREPRRVRFLALGAALAYVTVDDLFELHERVSEAFGEDVFGLPGHLAVRMWIVLFAPLLLGVLVLVAAEARRVRERVGTVLLAGLAALVAAVVVEIAGAVTRDPDFIENVSGKPETLRYLVEEGLELGGWTLIAGGLLCVLARDTGALRR